MTLLDDSHRTDLGLVAEVRLGRREAFGELYRRYYAGALRYALAMTRGDEARAQDIVSEAFTRVFRAMSRNGDVASFWPYLLASVRNAHRAEARHAGRVDLVERASDLDGLVPGSLNGGGHDDPGVQLAFRRLPPRWRDVLWRSEILGDTAAEIGQDLGITANAAAALALRAREGLRVEYLRVHLISARSECRPYAEQLAKLVRGMLGRRDRRRVETHVRGCDDCSRALAKLTTLNGRMRSVLPLILGVAPFASAQGITSGSAGAVVSGLVGSASAASGAIGAAGAAGTASAAGAAGATAGAAGLAGATAGAAGLAGATAAGITQAGAIAGLAVASVVAVLGLPVDEATEEPVQPPVARTVNITDDEGATDPAGSLVQPGVDNGESVAVAEEPTPTPTATSTPTAQPTAPPLAGDPGAVMGGQPVTGSDVIGAPVESQSQPPASGSVDSGSSAGAAPAVPQSTGGSSSSGSSGSSSSGSSGSSSSGSTGDTGSTQGGVVPEQNGSSNPPSSPGDQHSSLGTSETSAEPLRDGPATPSSPPETSTSAWSGAATATKYWSQDAASARSGPATPARPSRGAKGSRHDPSDKPAHGDKWQVGKATKPGHAGRHRRFR